MESKKTITAKDVYAYVHMCVDIQKMNLETYNSEVARAERVMRENPSNREAIKKSCFRNSIYCKRFECYFCDNKRE